MTHFYSGSSVMISNYPLLLWSSVATDSGDITSLSIATVTIWLQQQATVDIIRHTSPLLLRATVAMKIQ
jgi:hypothetical protein